MEATEAPVLRRHVVVVLVDRLDLATARAMQYARTLSPDDLRAVHFDIDTKAARELEQEWSRLGLARLPLEIIECPDRRLGRAAIELVADATLDGDTECTVLLPRRGYSAPVWQRFLHDRTADEIAAAVSQVPHVSATIVPFDVGGRFGERVRSYGRSGSGRAGRRGRCRRVRPGRPPRGGPASTGRAGATGRGDRRRCSRPTATLARARRGHDADRRRELRQRVRVAGRVKSIRVQPRAGTSNLECVLSDGTGGLLLVFQGRPKIAGIEPGARLVAEGMVGTWGRRPAMINPDYELVQGAPSDPAEP